MAPRKFNIYVPTGYGTFVFWCEVYAANRWEAKNTAKRMKPPTDYIVREV